jgi:lipopolysaccharide biosynthesis regulator YciM
VQDLLLLLLPVAAASGWYAARRSMRREKTQCVNDTSPQYFRGLNHLLNEEPDKAIDAFVEMLEVDSDTVETHLALGNLFRRRGEVERAIRLHQNLIARPVLTREQRAQALLELGQDYMRAGLYDRAENLFRELRDSKLHVRQALSNLLVIYERERDWPACLETADQLAGLTGDSRQLQKSHYYCEMALAARADGRNAEAAACLKKALSTEPRCVRARHLQGRFAAKQRDDRAAIRILQEAAEQESEYLPELLPDIVAAYRRLGDVDGLRAFLRRTAEAQPAAGAELVLFDLTRETEGDRAASEYAAAQLSRSPSLNMLLRSIDLNASMPASSSRDFLGGLRPHIQQMLDEKPVYQCNQCGFAAKTMHWQCPSCKHWSTIKRRADCLPL